MGIASGASPRWPGRSLEITDLPDGLAAQSGEGGTTARYVQVGDNRFVDVEPGKGLHSLIAFLQDGRLPLRRARRTACHGLRVRGRPWPGPLERTPPRCPALRLSMTPVPVHVGFANGRAHAY